MAEAFIDRRPNLNPGKGKGGIKPRYSMNLKRIDVERFQEAIDKAVDEALQTQMEK